MPQQAAILPVDTAQVAVDGLTPPGLRNLLNAAEDAPPNAVVEVIAHQLLRSVGATEVGFLIADLSGQRLVPITRVRSDEDVDVTEPEGAVAIRGSHAGHALSRQD